MTSETKLPEAELWVATGLRGLETHQPNHVVGVSRDEVNEEVKSAHGPGWAAWMTEPYYTAEQMKAYARAAVEQASEGDVVGTIHGYQKGTARPMVRWNRRPGDAGTPLYTRPQPSAGDAVAWIDPYHLGALRKRRDNKEVGYILVEVCDSETEDYCVPLYTDKPAAPAHQENAP